VGRDLTQAYSAFGEQGLSSLLEAMPFPMMKEIYDDKPLTDEENARLVAFLQEVSTSGSPAPAPSPGTFLIVSVAGFFLVAGIFQLLWRGRLSGVRRPLVKGRSK
jgi:hypothetical protein